MPVLLSYNSVSCVVHFRFFPRVDSGNWLWACAQPAPDASLSLLQVQVEGRSVDFIRHNACAAKRAPLRRSQSLQALAELLQQKQREQEEYNAKQKGHVPQ